MKFTPIIPVCLGLLAATARSASPARPNVLFILTEDQGAQTGIVDTPGLRTPHMDSLARTGVYFNNTIVVFLGDHGPCFQHGKMTLYDLGLRVPLAIRVPWLKSGIRTDALASELDLTPTLLDLLGLAPMPRSHGKSLKPILEGKPGAKGSDFVLAEISNRGTLPNDGMQERSVCDGRWKLIYRERLTPPWRQVQDDSKQWKAWGNRTYAETLRVKDQYPDAFRILAEMDPQSLGGKVPALELYDLKSDPDEMRNLAADPEHRAELERLYSGLCEWVRNTQDSAASPPEKLTRETVSKP